MRGSWFLFVPVGVEKQFTKQVSVGYLLLSSITECVQQGALLTLYTNTLLKLSACQSPVQEMSILTDIVTWCTRLKVR